MRTFLSTSRLLLRSPSLPLFPYTTLFRSHREHGPVRAHADHRRRGLLGALRRGLHGADLQDRLAALSGGRDRREEGQIGRASCRERGREAGGAGTVEQQRQGDDWRTVEYESTY